MEKSKLHVGLLYILLITGSARVYLYNIYLYKSFNEQYEINFTGHCASHNFININN